MSRLENVENIRETELEVINKQCLEKQEDVKEGIECTSNEEFSFDAVSTHSRMSNMQEFTSSKSRPLVKEVGNKPSTRPVLKDVGNISEIRKPLKDVANMSAIRPLPKDVGNKPERYEDRFPFQQQDSLLDIANVVEKADIALSKAKKVQRRIDNDFGLYLEGGNSRPKLPLGEEDIESCEVADILDSKYAIIEYGDKNIDSGILTFHDTRFRDYRLVDYRGEFT